MYKRASRFQQSMSRRGRKITHARQPVTTHAYYDLKLDRSLDGFPEPERGPSSVYLCSFRPRQKSAMDFVKIGISAREIVERFRDDLGNYEVFLLVRSVRLPEPDALTFEDALHRLFERFKYYPSIPLKSGNSECFRPDDEALGKMKRFICAIEGRALGCSRSLQDQRAEFDSQSVHQNDVKAVTERMMSSDSKVLMKLLSCRNKELSRMAANEILRRAKMRP
jgi:hypothetical protein